MATKIPAFTYTGAHTEQMIGDYWVIFLTTSGTLRFSYAHEIDVTVLGGGGGGGTGNSYEGGGGGGGGYQTIEFGVDLSAATAYDIVVGGGGSGGYRGEGGGGSDGTAGGQSSAFGFTADGGKGGQYDNAGGAGGAGGTGNGGNHRSAGESNTVHAFSDASFPLYGGGGGGGQAAGGSPYGGAGGAYPQGESHSGKAGCGYGGGGGGGRSMGSGADYTNPGGAGYQGIVVIRGSRDDQLPVKFGGTTLTRMTFDGSEVKHLIYGGTKLFMERVRRCADWSKPKTRFVLQEA